MSNLDFGRIEAITGGMYSGKTEELIRRIKRVLIAGLKVQVFKPSLDDRYGVDSVRTHDGDGVEAVAAKDSTDLLQRVDPDTQVVAIDEAQFFDDGLVQICRELEIRGKRVIVAGLDMDFKLDPFGPMPQILAMAYSVTKLTAVCDVCKSPDATLTQKLIGGEPAPSDSSVVFVGGRQGRITYQARCRRCHQVPQVEQAQLNFWPGGVYNDSFGS